MWTDIINIEVDIIIVLIWLSVRVFPESLNTICDAINAIIMTPRPR